MKRVICVFLVALMVVAVLPVGAFAAETEEITYFSDGSYVIRSIDRSFGLERSRKSGSSVYRYYGNNGDLEWTATLSATFTYDGSSATCTSSSCSVSVSNSAWYVISKSSDESGNTATGTVTMGYKTLGITTNKKTIDLILSCDADGNLS